MPNVPTVPIGPWHDLGVFGLRLTRLVSVAVAIAAAAGCSKPAGESGSASTSAPSSTASPAAAPAFDIEGFCEKVMALPGERKCNADDEVREQNKFGYCGTLLRRLRDGGRVSFDAKAAKPCIDAVAAADPPLPDSRTLQDVGTRIEACRKVVIGKQNAGASCESSAECVSGHVCAKAKCVAAAGNGQACEEIREVSLAGVTSSCVAGHVCVEGKCAAKPEEKRVAAGAACTADAACAAGHFCDTKTRACAAKKEAGAKCASSRECRGRCSKADGACVDYCGSG